MIVASPHIPVMGPSNTPCSEPPASTTNTSSEQLWYSESLPDRLERPKHRLGKSLTLPALSWAVQKQLARSNLRACSGSGVVDAGELGLSHTSEWKLVSSTLRGLCMPTVWYIWPILDVYLKISESSCNELFEHLTLILKAKVLIICPIQVFLILVKILHCLEKKMWWITCYY